EDLTDSGYENFDDLRKIQQAARELLSLVGSRLADGLVEPARLPEAGDAPQSAVRALSTLPATADAEASITGRILVVDDNRENRQLLAKRLERQGHQTAQAGDGRVAL